MTFNHQDHILECLQSIEMQKTTFDFEVVIGDDFSTDNNLSNIDEFISKSKNPKIHYRILSRVKGDEYHKERQLKGRLYNFIDILNKCKGKYVALLDGDDYWTDPYKLQKQVDYMDAHPECVITGHDAQVIDTAGKLIKESKLPEEKKRDATSEDLKMGFWILTLSMVFRNVPILQNYPKEFTKVKNGDTFLISILGQYGYYHYMPEITPAVYRVHESGVWSMKNPIFQQTSSVLTKYHTGIYYKRQNDNSWKKLFNWVLRKGVHLFETQKEELTKLQKHQKHQFIHVLVATHKEQYGVLRTIKFAIKKYLWLYFGY